jgi:hypothetical protein
VTEPSQALDGHAERGCFRVARGLAQHLEERGHGVGIADLRQTAQGSEAGDWIRRVGGNPAQPSSVSTLHEPVEVVARQRELDSSFERSAEAVEEACHGDGS